MDRQIVHYDLDTFFVSVERLQNSALIGKPVLVGGSSDRAVVASCSYEARSYGVHAAMPMRLARQLCPEAVVVRGDFDSYLKYSAMVTEIIQEKAPVVEKASIDEHYLDMTGMDRFFNTWQFSKELRARIMDQTGLPISFGLSVNKTVSKIATGEVKPSGEQKIDIGLEKSFLAPLSISKIPGIGDKTYPKLRQMGVSKIKTLQELDVRAMRELLGENGVTIWKKANAIDTSAVVPFQEQKSLSKENTFEQDTIDMQVLKKVLLTMVDQLAFELRQGGRLMGCVTLKIRYSNFDTHTMQATLGFTSSERAISEKVLELFTKLYTRRMLIRLVGVKFTKLIYGSYQANLFEDTQEDLNLSKALDHIRNRFGSQAVIRGFALPLK